MDIEIGRFDSPDEVKVFEKGKLEVVRAGGTEVGRATYEPGWKWSEHVGAELGKESCDVEHVVMVLSGHMMIAMDDGDEILVGAGDLCYVPPGHDAWVVGDQPYVSLHLVGAHEYAEDAGHVGDSGPA